MVKSPEIVIGLVSPVGTDMQPVINALKNSFDAMKYDVHWIKISETFMDIADGIKDTSITNIEPQDRTEKYIEFGNSLRERFGNEFLSKIAIKQIVLKRSKKSSKDNLFEKNVFIVDQLKTTKEIDLLKLVYGEAFFQMSVYSARDVRVDHIARKMAKAVNKRDSNPYRAPAESLVSRDDDEKIDYGQKVGKIFQLADVVINIDVDMEKTISGQVDRFVRLLFGSNAISPNRMEYGMYLAHSAALRSLDLSRQVGAAIFRCTGEVATLGANEVPKAGGGTYWIDEKYDAREFTRNLDSNDERKKELLNEVIKILGKNIEDLTDKELKDLKESQFMDALEYGRIVHAEMSAITDAARLGINLKGAKLYCTTFPCHMCSKHIVSSGIDSVVFLEPYPKSLTSDLHSDSVAIEGASRAKYDSFPSVDFVPFYGVTPTRYRDLFYRTKRKDKNGFVEYKTGRPLAIFAPKMPVNAEVEVEVAKQALTVYAPHLIKELVPEAEVVGS